MKRINKIYLAIGIAGLTGLMYFLSTYVHNLTFPKPFQQLVRKYEQDRVILQELGKYKNDYKVTYNQKNYISGDTTEFEILLFGTKKNLQLTGKCLKWDNDSTTFFDTHKEYTH